MSRLNVRKFLGCCSTVTLTLWSSFAVAAEIPVANSGFETPVTAGISIPPISGWNSAPFGPLVYNPNDSDGVWALPGGLAPEGQNVLIATRGGAGGNTPVSQTVSASLTAGTAYSLQVLVGAALQGVPQDVYPYRFYGYDVQLLAGSTVIAQALNTFAPTFGYGEFKDISLNYTAAADDPLLGQPLTISLNATSDNLSYVRFAFFDNVRLNAAVVPEPSTFGLASLGGAIMLARLVRRRRSA